MIEDADKDYSFDAIVIGAGHAGIEASLALARMGRRTLTLSVTLDNIGYLACNPSIGGTAKGHLVREVDALGGQMGVTADKTLTQLRMLNRGKGVAVHSLRAQVDKYRYHDEMKRILENQPGLTLRQGEVRRILVEDGEASGVETVTGLVYRARVVVAATGVYLKSTIIVGSVIEERGPVCFQRANYLSDSLRELGIGLRRFKTGTPARVKRDSVDFSRLEVQEGEDTPYTFSVMSGKVNAKKSPCYLGYTNGKTHEIIQKNLHLSPKHAGLIHGTGARYCPSIEDKIVKFADKERHQFFLEPEGDCTQEMYVQGVSTGLPASVQLPLYRSIEGFGRVEIMRDAYAIEYDCIDPTQLYPTLMLKKIRGLFFAGQINGTSGYEEAAAQGIVAGINAALHLTGRPPMILTRNNSYIGVMIDDLVTVGTDEPYRMMTSRAEYRLSLRQDNADLRLTPIGYKVGLADGRRYRRYLKKVREIARAEALLTQTVPAEAVAAIFTEAGADEAPRAMKASDVIRRASVTQEIFCRHSGLFGSVGRDALFEVFTSVKYEGYLIRQEKARAEAARMENTPLPPDIDYLSIDGLRLEAREKLDKIRPLSVGQAMRISGVTPSDVNVLIIRLFSK